MWQEIDGIGLARLQVDWKRNGSFLASVSHNRTAGKRPKVGNPLSY